MSVEPGWYHAQGDPVGTVRLWNGQDWVGFAQRDPKLALESANVQAWEPHLGQIRLGILARVVQFMFVIMGAALTFAILTSTRAIGIANDTLFATGVPSDAAEDSLVFAGLAWIITGIAYMATGLLFVIWFYIAYANVALWHRTQHGPIWAVIVWMIPFLNLFRPLRIMMELMERSPRRENEGALNPVLAIVWWALWSSPMVISSIVFVFGPEASRGLQITLWIVLAAMLGAIALVITMVGQISRHQDSRLEPTAEQVELFEREEATKASLAGNSVRPMVSPEDLHVQTF